MSNNPLHSNDDWKQLEEALKNKTILQVQVQGFNDHGLKARIGGLRGLLPFGRFSPERRERLNSSHQDSALQSMIGEKISVFVYRTDRKSGFVYLSEPEYSQERFFNEQDRKAWDEAEQLMVDKKVISSSITGYKKFGLIVPLGILRGLVPFAHLSEARKKTSHEMGAERYFQSIVGQPISIMVIKMDRNKKRLILSERAVGKEKIFESIQVGTMLEGHVVKVADFGVFVDLGGVVGLIHISEIGSISECGFSIKTVKKGQFIKARVLSIDLKKRRINLSVKFP